MSSSPTVAPLTSHSPWRTTLDVLLVFFVFALDGAWPAPDVNEAHYLVKAKHYWEPHWIEGDIFLDSADSHLTFYATIGWLTQIMPLPAAAWCGRLIIWGLTAWGWRRLSYALVPRFGWAALSAAAALAFCERLHMAGEWFAGGCEAKCVAYALVFAGAASVVRGRWNRGLVLLGVASAFHVLVGGWAIVASAVAWLVAAGDRPRLATLWPGLVAAGLLSLPGLLPGLALTRGVEPSIVAQANEIYVNDRLSHHLKVQDFPVEFRLRHAALWVTWIACCLLRPAGAEFRRLRGFILGTASITLLGLAISYLVPTDNPWKAALLRFYWFRPGDVFGAVGTALELLGAAAAATTARGRGALLVCLAAVGGVNLLAVVGERLTSPMGRGEKLAFASNLSTWRDVCAWVKANTPPNSLCVTPRSFQTFKWYAERPEAAVWKDVPQDAPSLVEWRRRLKELYGNDSIWLNFVPPERLREFMSRYGVRYAVTYRLPPLALPVVYANNEFAVYEFVENPAEGARSAPSDAPP